MNPSDKKNKIKLKGCWNEPESQLPINFFRLSWSYLVVKENSAGDEIKKKPQKDIYHKKRKNQIEQF
jgi:hypothetical protein